MSYPKIVLALCLVMIGLSACSSSFGEGSPPPRNTTVVVPPNSTTTTQSTTTPY